MIRPTISAINPLYTAQQIDFAETGFAGEYNDTLLLVETMDNTFQYRLMPSA